MDVIRVKILKFHPIELIFRFNKAWQGVIGLDLFAIYRIEKGKVYFIDIIDIRVGPIEFALRILMRKFAHALK